MILPLLLFGVMQGSGNPLQTGFAAEFYGTRHIGGIKAALAAVMVLGSALGPGVTGFLIDRGMTMVDQMPWIAAYLIVASGFVWIGISQARRSLPAAA